MRHLSNIVLALALLTTALASGQAVSGNDAAQTLEKMEQHWADAAKKQDAGPLQEMLADDFLLTITTGQVVDKDSYVSKVKDGTFKIESIEYGNMKVRIHGGCAVVVGRVTLKATWDGADISGEYAFTDTFAKQGNTWRQVAGQVNRVEG